MHEMMKELITSKPIYQLPHVKDLMIDLDNNYNQQI
jgi:succinate dehydrogenase/fumarate reductase-like Fe-S protein